MAWIPFIEFLQNVGIIFCKFLIWNWTFWNVWTLLSLSKYKQLIKLKKQQYILGKMAEAGWQSNRGKNALTGSYNLIY